MILTRGHQEVQGQSRSHCSFIGRPWNTRSPASLGFLSSEALKRRSALCLHPAAPAAPAVPPRGTPRPGVAGHGFLYPRLLLFAPPPTLANRTVLITDPQRLAATNVRSLAFSCKRTSWSQQAEAQDRAIWKQATGHLLAKRCLAAFARLCWV